jgi:hypothetical protein
VEVCAFLHAAESTSLNTEDAKGHGEEEKKRRREEEKKRNSSLRGLRAE